MVPLAETIYGNSTEQALKAADLTHWHPGATEGTGHLHLNFQHGLAVASKGEH